MIKSFLVNLGLTTLKLLGSFFSHSKTLRGDSMHCLSDMVTDIMGLIGSKLSNKKPDESHPYGYGIIIIALGLITLINVFTGNLEKTNFYAAIVIIIGIIIKYTLSRYLLKKGKQYNSCILTTNGLESRYDSFCSLFALIFILLTMLGSRWKIFLYADILGGIITSALTLKVGFEILKENISSILGEIETDETKLNKIKNIINKHSEIKEIKTITLLKYGSYYNATIEIKMPKQINLKEINKIETKIKESLLNEDLNIKFISINSFPI